MNNPLQSNLAPSKTIRLLNYVTVWRWHFYAGLFCIPFAVWLSISGLIYLFKPQIQPWLDSDYRNLTVVAEAGKPSQQVAAALAAVPGHVLNAYQLPDSANDAVQILVGKGKKLQRVYVHPQSLAILHIAEEDNRFMRLIFRLHGELLLGDKGSMVVELAASWMIVLIITGLYLWWPRNTNSAAGIVYPRLHRGSRVFWRDLHAVTGLWVSFFLLFLLISGLPWAKSWGGLLKQVRQIGTATAVKQDWTTGRASELAQRQAGNTPLQGDSEHELHQSGRHLALLRQDYTGLDRLVETVKSQQLAPPVMISPPSKARSNWMARSRSQNRTLRAELTLDGKTGNILERKDFSQRPLLDRIIGVGIAAHEGQLFGWFNQFLGVFTALGVIAMAISAAVLWWGRRPAGKLGVPKASRDKPLPVSIMVLIVVLGMLLPLLGLSLLAILAIEFALLRRLAWSRKFLDIND